MLPQQQLPPTDNGELTNETQDVSSLSQSFQDIIPWVVQFRIVGTPHLLRSTIAPEILIGRQDNGLESQPDIDLGNYGGAAEGVSRRHARLVAKDNRITVEDLGSSNGTFLNNRPIGIGNPVRLYDGDRLRLGNLQLQVNFVVKPTSADDTNHNMTITVPQIASGEVLLVVDDNPDVCQVVRFIAQRAGFEVAQAHTINEAINRMDAGTIDLALVEMLLPDGSGLDILRYSRRRRLTVPVMMTGATGMKTALDAGAALFLNKPLAIEELLHKLKALHTSLTA